MPSNLESANRGAAEGWLDKARIARRRGMLYFGAGPRTNSSEFCCSGDTRNALRLVDKSLGKCCFCIIYRRVSFFGLK